MDLWNEKFDLHGVKDRLLSFGRSHHLSRHPRFIVAASSSDSRNSRDTGHLRQALAMGFSAPC